MGNDDKKPDGASAGSAPAPEPARAKLPGAEDGKWSFEGADGSHSEKTPSHEQKVSVGNRRPTAEDKENSEKPKTTNEIVVKPLYSKTVFDNTLEKGHGNKESDDDQSYYSTLTAKLSLEAVAASVDVKEKKAKLTLVEAKAEGSVVHAQFDVGGWLHDLLFKKTPEPPPPNPTSPLVPMAARIGDMTTHGTPLAPGTGSTNVIIGGMPAWRVGPDMHACPGTGAVSHGAGPTSLGALTVLINGFPAARAGDFVDESLGGPNVILVGCPTVLIGPPAALAPPTPPPPKPAADETPWVLFEGLASGDAAAGEAALKVEAEGDLKKLKGKAELIGGGEAAVLKGELPLKLRIRIPYTTYYLGLGVTAKGTLLAVGAEAGIGAKINDGKKLFEATGGASASIGPGGLGAKFSLDVAKK